MRIRCFSNEKREKSKAEDRRNEEFHIHAKYTIVSLFII
jgi:hypothetical protein